MICIGWGDIGPARKGEQKVRPKQGRREPVIAWGLEGPPTGIPRICPAKGGAPGHVKLILSARLPSGDRSPSGQTGGNGGTFPSWWGKETSTAPPECALQSVAGSIPVRWAQAIVVFFFSSPDIH